jgi:hypothetical protein
MELAASELVESNREIVDDLLRSVMGLDPMECLVTDESSLWDFHDEESNAPFIEKIGTLYGVDVADLDPPTLAVISGRIRERLSPGRA